MPPVERAGGRRNRTGDTNNLPWQTPQSQLAAGGPGIPLLRLSSLWAGRDFPPTQPGLARGGSPPSAAGARLGPELSAAGVGLDVPLGVPSSPQLWDLGRGTREQGGSCLCLHLLPLGWCCNPDWEVLYKCLILDLMTLAVLQQGTGKILRRLSSSSLWANTNLPQKYIVSDRTIPQLGFVLPETHPTLREKCKHLLRNWKIKESPGRARGAIFQGHCE